MAVSKRLRFEVLRRDDHRCRYCGRSAPEVALTVDHVHPVALGGTDDPTNLVTACRDCNSGKTSVPPDAPLVAQVAAYALKWARAIELVAQERAEQRARIDDLHQAFRRAWDRWSNTETRDPVPLGPGWKGTVEAVHLAGLSEEEIVRLVEVAMVKPGVTFDQRWTYYCGCLWRNVDALQDRARELIAFGEQWERDIAAQDAERGADR